MVYSPILIRRLRSRKIYEHNGIRNAVANNEQPTDYSLSVHNRKKRRNAPVQGRAVPVHAIFNDSRRKAMRRAVNLRANRAIQKGRMHAEIDLNSSVPRPRKIKNKKQLRKCERRNHSFLFITEITN